MRESSQRGDRPSLDGLRDAAPFTLLAMTEHLTYRDVAEVTGVTEAQCASTIRQELRQLTARLDGAPPADVS